MDLLKNENGDKDIFGLPKLSTDAEIAISFTLTVLGLLLIAATALTMPAEIEVSPLYLGMLLVATGYFFLMESVRELEQKDHFLSRKLMKKDEEEE